jgi:hypothetical protein
VRRTLAGLGAALGAALALAMARPAGAAPGGSLASERTRLAAITGLAPVIRAA